jgi:O-antigen/teichoic acid export membrane protein
MEQPAVTSRHVAKGVGTTLLARIGAVIEIVSQPLYVWMFGLASFGLYTVLWAAINLAENIFDLGMTSAMQRTVPQAHDEQEAARSLRAALILGVAPNILVAIVVSLFAPEIAPLLNVAAKDQALVVPAIQLFIWALPLWAFVEIATSALRARHLFGPEIRLRIVWEQIIRLVLAVTFFAFGLGLAGLFVAHMISLAITALLSFRLLHRHYDLATTFGRSGGGGESRMFGETVKAGLSALPYNMVARLFGDAPPIVLNLMLPGSTGASSAALYMIARKITSLVQLVRTAFAYVLAPLASSAARQDKSHVAELYGFTTRIMAAIVLPLALVLVGGTMPILSLFGSAADHARGAVILLLLARMGETLLGAAQPVLQVVSGYSRQVVASTAGLVAAVLAGLVLVPWSPLSGMAGAVGIGLIVQGAIPMIQLHVYDKLHPFAHGFWRVLSISALISIPALGLALLVSSLPDAASLPMIVVVAMGAIWCSGRFALAEGDRRSLGKTGRKLRLVPA